MEGGIRTRLISDSVYHLVHDSLGDLGWFDPGRNHKPIQMRTEPYPNREDIPLNAVVVSDTVTTDEDAELGSNLGEMATTYYVDFYAESEALGKDLIGDVRDILRGRIPSIGRTDSTLPVYDWRMATPSLLFYCDIQDVLVEQVHDVPKPFLMFWRLVRFDVIDSY